jgi:hypothetical protein
MVAGVKGVAITEHALMLTASATLHFSTYASGPGHYISA